MEAIATAPQIECMSNSWHERQGLRDAHGPAERTSSSGQSTGHRTTSHSWEGLGGVGARPQHSSTTAAQQGPGARVHRILASEYTETLLLISLWHDKQRFEVSASEADPLP